MTAAFDSAPPPPADLEAALTARDPDAFLVYADWLAARSDPRSAWIAIQAQRERAPDDAEFAAAEAAMLAKHKQALLPALLAKLLALRRRTQPSSEKTDASWRRGFLDAVTLARRTPGKPSLEEAAAELLVHRSARHLRSLTLAKLGAGLGDYYERLLGAIARTGHAQLSELVVGAPGTALDLSHRHVPGVVEAVGALPRLERLVVRAGAIELRGLAHAHLREVELVTSSATDPDPLAEAQLPRLARLTITGATLGAQARAALQVSHPALELVGDATPALYTVAAAEARAAAHPSTIDAAHPIAYWRRWSLLGRDAAHVWGRYVGTGGEYRVFASLAARESGCNCASQVRPCKHVVALLLLAANGHAYKARPLPAEVRATARAED